jgi:threonine dehydratase
VREWPHAGTAANVDLEAIRKAHGVIDGRVYRTPLWPASSLEQIAGVAVWLKCEQMQRTGSFKIRGALNFVTGLAKQGVRGLVAASAGNHAQGVALAGKEAGLPVSVVMPVTAPLAKVTATQKLGARVLLEGNSLEEARAEALAIAARDGLVFVPPFDDDAIIAGQGTVGLEILEQAPDIDRCSCRRAVGGCWRGLRSP